MSNIYIPGVGGGGEYRPKRSGKAPANLGKKRVKKTPKAKAQKRKTDVRSKGALAALDSFDLNKPLTAPEDLFAGLSPDVANKEEKDVLALSNIKTKPEKPLSYVQRRLEDSYLPELHKKAVIKDAPKLALKGKKPIVRPLVVNVKGELASNKRLKNDIAEIVDYYLPEEIEGKVSVRIALVGDSLSRVDLKIGGTSLDILVGKRISTEQANKLLEELETVVADAIKAAKS